MKTVVITGASGFIGRALTKRLLKNNTRVYAIVRNVNSMKELEENKNLFIIQNDISEYKELPKKINEKIDVFFHLAWDGVSGNDFINYDLQLKNSIYSADALTAAVELKCNKFVLAGTVNEYEVLEYLIKNEENTNPRLTNIYSSSKIAANMICRTLANKFNIDYNAGLIAMGYGEGKRQDVLPNVVIKKLLRNEKVLLTKGLNNYDLIYIDDIIEALIAIAINGKNMKNYYVGHQEQETLKELMIKIRDIVNPKGELMFGYYEDNLDLDYNKIPLNELHDDTGFSCKSDFKESIIATSDWIKENLI